MERTMPPSDHLSDNPRTRSAAQHVLAHVNRTHHFAYTLVGRLPGGYQQGAWLLRDSGSSGSSDSSGGSGDPGREAVLKWSRDSGSSEQARRAAPLIGWARKAGWPTPAWYAVGATPSGYSYHVQERVPGSPARHVTLPVARAALRVIDGQAGLRPDTAHDWSRYDHRVVFEGEGDFTANLGAFSPAGAEFVGAVRVRTAPFRDTPLPASDLVHGDFNPDNILLADDAGPDPEAGTGAEPGIGTEADADAGTDAGAGADPVTITAVTDAAALGKGTRLHDVATLISYAVLWPAEPALAVPAALPDLFAYGRCHAAAGELEVTLAATLLALLAFVTTHHPDSADTVLRTATALLTALPAPPAVP
jgi:hypothetical protein